MTAERLEGGPVAEAIREDVAERAHEQRAAGTVPTLGTVLMSDSPDQRRFMELKHEACDELGIETRDVRVDAGADPGRLYAAIEELASDLGIDAIFVQTPLPDRVSTTAVRNRLDPAKDVDCLHPENVGRLVAGDPRYVPATTAAVLRILDHYDVATAGQDAVVVGRSQVIGRPLANVLVDPSYGDATVTVCHSRTDDLGAKTREGDLVVTAAGVPGLVDGSMLAEGAVVVDVSANRTGTDDDGEQIVVGDVEAESAADVAGAMTPVPGGVGPVTLACLVENVVRASGQDQDRS